MKNILIATLALALTAAMPITALAQDGGGYDLTWSTLSGGGGTSAAGGYTLLGTIGQPDASTALSGGGYTLVGGFGSGTALPYHVYLPLVLRNQ